MGLSERFSSYLLNRKFKVDILTLFLSLFTISFVLIMWLGYTHSYRSILKFSISTDERISHTIIDKFNALVQRFETLGESTSILFTHVKTPLEANEELIHYLERIILLYPNVDKIYVGLQNGGCIDVENVQSTGQTHSLVDPSQPLPPNTTLAVNIIDPSKQLHVGDWIYKDRSFHILGREKGPTD